MTVSQRRQSCHIFFVYGIPLPAKLLQSRFHVNCIPQDNDIEHQAQGAQLVFLSLAVLLTQLATLAMKYLTGQTVAAFSSIELGQYGAPLFFAVDIGQHVQGFVDTPEFRQGLRQATHFGSALQSAHDTGRRNPPEFQRTRQSQ